MSTVIEYKETSELFVVTSDVVTELFVNGECPIACELLIEDCLDQASSSSKLKIETE